MNEKLYNLMDWARVETIIYSEEDHPHDFLGPHVTKEGVLIQVFLPTAKKVMVKLDSGNKMYPMDQEDEEGFFAALIPGKKIPKYQLEVTFDNGSICSFYDAYAFSPDLISEREEKKFNAGICYDVYEYLGAHPVTVDGISGVYFAVWAPNAARVSVVGDFVLWDGRRLPMRKRDESGIFELFVPGLKEGTIYKYEVKAKGGLTFLKADPYGNAAELRPATASVVADISGFEWTDEKWIARREKSSSKTDPMLIYELHLGSWKKPADGREFYNYRELAPMIAEYVKEMGYTHIQLMPVMEHPLDASWGYQVIGYYAPTARHGSPKDFMYFMNYMHEQGISVILDWAPAYFPRDVHGLCGFDGTCLYEHHDPRKGSHPRWGTLLYNYGRPEVVNYLIANALFWVEKYHADGIRIDSVSSMLYLDYDKTDGEWVANMYGGRENLEAVEFLKHLNSMFHQCCPGAVLIAEESAAWPKVTGALDDDGLGFDYKCNTGWMNDFLEYIQLDPVFRGYHHGELTFSMVYNYSEDFILPFSHDAVSAGKGSMLSKMPGKREMKFANLRAAYGYMMVHPGKKLLFMGQDLGLQNEWHEDKGLDWQLAQQEDHQKLKAYVTALLAFCKASPALYQMDYDPEGFEWINSISANENIVVFLRKSKKEEDTLLVVCNFSALCYEDHKIGVPFAGKFKEVFSSDREEYGGAGNLNPRLKNSRKDECDGFANSIRIKVPPMGISIFSCTKIPGDGSQNDAVRAKKTVKDAGTKKKTVKKNLKEELERKIAQEG